MKVTLEDYEVELAKFIGMRRNTEAVKQGRTPAHGFKGNGEEIHILGAAGEIALAKYLNIYYSGSVNTFKLPDLGKNIQVRTRTKSNYELIIRPDDNEKDYYVLVRGNIPEFDIVGWIWGKNGMKKKYLQSYGDRPEAYFVPDEKLKDMELLKAKLYKESNSSPKLLVK